MKKIYDALDIIKEYLGTEVYEVCLLGEKDYTKDLPMAAWGSIAKTVVTFGKQD